MLRRLTADKAEDTYANVFVGHQGSTVTGEIEQCQRLRDASDQALPPRER